MTKVIFVRKTGKNIDYFDAILEKNEDFKDEKIIFTEGGEKQEFHMNNCISKQIGELKIIFSI